MDPNVSTRVAVRLNHLREFLFWTQLSKVKESYLTRTNGVFWNGLGKSIPKNEYNIRVPPMYSPVKFVLGFLQCRKPSTAYFLLSRKKWSFHENIYWKPSTAFYKKWNINICAHRNAICIRSLESSRQARFKTPHLFASSTIPLYRFGVIFFVIAHAVSQVVQPYSCMLLF